MRRLLSCLLLLAVWLPAQGVIPAAGAHEVSSQVQQHPPRKKRVKQHATEWARAYGVVRLKRRRITHLQFTGSQPVNPRPARPAATRRASYTCVKQTSGHRVISFSPVHLDMGGNAFFHQWTLFVTKANRARKVRGRRMKQFEFCATGGGHTWNKWNADFEGAAISIKDRPDIKIGDRWGETVSDDGGVHSTLGFELGTGTAKVSASTPVGIDDDLRFTGTNGSDTHIYVPDEYVDADQTNGYYFSSDTWTFQGTDRWVGNNLHVLYEVPQSARGGLPWVIATKISAHCTKWFQLLGRRCESFS